MSKCFFVCKSLEETRNLGKALGRVAPKGLVVILKGDLGCGKTEFVKGLATTLGIPEDEVSSPSFNLVHEYDSLVHVDLYRVGSNFGDLGLEEILEDERVKAVEWGEPVLEFLKGIPYVVVSCREAEDGRLFEIEDFGLGLCEKIKREVLDVKDS